MIGGGGSTANRAAADVIGTPGEGAAGVCGACEAGAAGAAGPAWPACPGCEEPWPACAAGAAWLTGRASSGRGDRPFEWLRPLGIARGGIGAIGRGITGAAPEPEIEPE
ncbi:MAG: hypothetical protein ACREBE_17970, partial [bacterium]